MGLRSEVWIMFYNHIVFLFLKSCNFLPTETLKIAAAQLLVIRVSNFVLISLFNWPNNIFCQVQKMPDFVKRPILLKNIYAKWYWKKFTMYMKLLLFISITHFTKDIFAYIQDPYEKKPKIISKQKTRLKVAPNLSKISVCWGWKKKKFQALFCINIFWTE